MTSIKEKPMTRHEQQYYDNIERIATALEKLVAQGKEDKLNKFKKVSNILYGNDATVKPDKGRSDDNYTYPQFVDKHYKTDRPTTGSSKSSTGRTALESFVPDIQSDLDERIHKESQSITGGEFSNWHSNLTSEERESYRRIYGH
jgi:hypothetical protein